MRGARGSRGPKGVFFHINLIFKGAPKGGCVAAPRGDLAILRYATDLNIIHLNVQVAPLTDFFSRHRFRTVNLQGSL